jgi:hypothetical protein
MAATAQPAPLFSIDDETVVVLRQRKADQAAEQLKAGDSWRGTKDSYVFTTGWGQPIYPNTVTSLMTKLIRADKQLPHARLHDLRHLRAPCCCPASRFTSSRPGSATQTRPSPSAYTPMSSQRGGCRSGHLRKPSRPRVSKPVSKKAG